MKYGFSVPTRGELAAPEPMVKIVKHAEDLGYTYAGVSDHVIVPRKVAPVYPYSENGEFVGVHQGGKYLEQISLLAYFAAVTKKIRLLTSVMVVPHRPCLLVAKMLATIDVLSNGRLTVGCGAGWMAEEFEALQAPPFAERGKVVAEYIQGFRELWTKDDPRFDGKYVKFGDIHFMPKPVQKPHPPIWIGGESDPAMKRAAKFAEGWFPIGANPKFPLDTPERFGAAVARLKTFAREAGRDPATLDLAYYSTWYDETKAQKASDGTRRAFTGTAQEIAGDLRRYRDLGVRHMMVNILGTTLDATLKRLDYFVEKVQPLVGK